MGIALFGGWKVYLSIYYQSDEEFQQTYLTYKPDGRERREVSVPQWLLEPSPDLPPDMDWRRAGAVTRVKQQVPYNA